MLFVRGIVGPVGGVPRTPGWIAGCRLGSKQEPLRSPPPDSPCNVFSVCLFSLKKKNGFTFMLYFPHPGWMGVLGRGKGTLYQEVLYPEKQILHDWTAAFVLYCLCMCVCGFFFPPSSPRSFTFLHTHSSSFSPLLLSFVPGWGEKMCVGFLEETKQHKTKQKNNCVFWMRPNQTEGRAK